MVPVLARRMSPGLTRVAARQVLGGADHASPRAPAGRAGRSRRSPRARRRAPDMSNFISLIFAPGLIEMPPESNVTPLPTKPSTGPATSWRLVADRDQLRLLVGAAGDGGEGAHARRLDLRAAPDLDLHAGQRAGARRPAPSASSRCRARSGGRARRWRPRRRSPRARRRRSCRGGRRRPARRRRARRRRRRSCTRGTRRRRARALDEARRIDVVRDLPAQHARAELLRAAQRPLRRPPGALAVELVALAEPGQHVAPPAGVGDRDLAQARSWPRRSRPAPAARRRRHGRSPRPRTRRRRSCRRRCRAAPPWWNSRA